MIDTVIFDIGKVLVAFDWEGYLQTFHYSKEVSDIVANAMFLNEDWELGDTGLITKSQWLSHFIENAPQYEKQIRQVYDTLGKCIYRFPYTLEWIHHYREKGYRIFYLSNYSEGLYEKTKEVLSFTDSFDGGIFSYREKCIKPDLEIYRKLIKRYDIVPENALFFDDREENIAASKKLGIHGVLFTKETDYEKSSKIWW
ncbi:MAG: HAD family phosphatase [Lachnospiraceae bacterium]